MRKRFLFGAFLLTLGALQSAECVFNSTFDLGHDGFFASRFLRPDTNAQMRYLPLETVRENSNAVLRVDNPYNERIELNAIEIQLKQNTVYRCSVRLKSSVPMEIQCNVTGTHPVHRWDSARKTFKTDSQWRTFAFEFKTKDKPFRFYTPRLNFQAEGTLFMDDLSIREKGDVSPRIPELSAVPEKNYFIQPDNGRRSVPVRLSATNPTAQELRFRLKLNVLENRDGNWPDPKLRPLRTLDCGLWTVPANGILTRTVDVETPEFGAFDLHPEAEGVKLRTYGKPFAVLGEYRARDLNLDRDFCSAVNSAFGFGYPPHYRFRQPAFFSLGGSPDALMQFYRAQGIRLLREWGVPGWISWYMVEPNPGEFDFSALDRTVDLVRRNGLYFMPVIGGSDFWVPGNIKRTRPEGLPDWLIAKSEKELARSQKDFSRTALFKPPVELWKRFVSAYAKHAGKRITHYEIMNEPHLGFWAKPADYVPYLKGAYEALKEADPANRVVGFCATSDLGARMAAFYEPCFKAGGLEYSDIVSFHPYQNPKLGSLQPADKTVRIIRELIAQYAKKKYPLWNTELYYLRGKVGPAWSHGYNAAHDLAQRMLTDLGEGLAQSISPEATQLLRQSSPHYISSDGIGGDLTPNSFGVVLNAFGRYLEGAVPVGKIRWENDSICYIYRLRDTGYCAAFWNYGAGKGLSVSFNCKGTLRDMFGNPLPLKKKIELNEEPKLFFFSGQLPEYEKALSDAKIHAGQPLKAAPSARLLPHNGGFALAVGLKNLSAEEVSGQIGVAAAKQALPFKLAPHSEQSFLIPLRKAAEGKQKIRILSMGRRFDFTCELLPLPKRIGTTGETCSASVPKTAGLPPLNNSWSLTRRGDSLLFAIQVSDSTPSGAPGARKYWERDCIELFLDTMPEALPIKHTEFFNANVLRFFLLPGTEKCEVVTQPRHPVSERLSAKMTRDASGYGITLEIPLKSIFGTIPPAGKLLGFEVKIDDARPDGSIREYLWNAAEKPYLLRTHFGLLTLK